MTEAEYEGLTLYELDEFRSVIREKVGE